MTTWQYIKFRLYWCHLGRKIHYSRVFPWPGYWYRLFGGEILQTLRAEFNGHWKKCPNKLLCYWQILKGRPSHDRTFTFL